MAITKLSRPLLILSLGGSNIIESIDEFFRMRVYPDAYRAVSVEDANITELTKIFSNFIESSYNGNPNGVTTSMNFNISVIVNLDNEIDMLETIVTVAKNQFKINDAGFFFDVYFILDEQYLDEGKINAIKERLAKLDSVRSSFMELSKKDQSMDSIFYIVSNRIYTGGFIRNLEKNDIESMILYNIFINGHAEPYLSRAVFHDNVFKRNEKGEKREGFCTIGYKKISKKNEAVNSFIIHKLITDNAYEDNATSDNKSQVFEGEPSLIDIDVRFTEVLAGLDETMQDTSKYKRIETVLSLPINAKKDGRLTGADKTSQKNYLNAYFGDGVFEQYAQVNCSNAFDEKVEAFTHKFRNDMLVFFDGSDSERVDFYRAVRFLNGECVNKIKNKLKSAEVEWRNKDTNYRQYMNKSVTLFSQEFGWPEDIVNKGEKSLEIKCAYLIASGAVDLFITTHRELSVLKLLKNWLAIVNEYLDICNQIKDNLNSMSEQRYNEYLTVQNGDKLFSTGFTDDCTTRYKTYFNNNKEKVNNLTKHYYRERGKKRLDEFLSEKAKEIKLACWDEEMSFYDECSKRFESAKKSEELHTTIEAYLIKDKVYCINVTNYGGYNPYEPVCFIYSNPKDQEQVSEVFVDNGGEGIVTDTGIRFFEDNADETEIFVIYIKGCFSYKYISNGKYAELGDNNVGV